MPNLTELRRQKRTEREALPKQTRLQNSLDASRHFICTLATLRSKKIALYLAADGELDPLPLIVRLLRLNKKIYLPVLRPGKKKALWFAEYRPDDYLRPNRFGILEPDTNRRKPIPTWGLDLIVMPLVAFSADGTRMGMGGGYYDRTLSYQRCRENWKRPKLIGYAHACQQVKNLPIRNWDIPLHGIITEHGYHSFAFNHFLKETMD